MMSSRANCAILVLLIAGTTFLPGCASKKAANAPVKNATIVVEGRHRGGTPATINIFRNRGEYNVMLMQGNKVVRHFEIGIGGEQRGPERHLIDMDLARDLSSLGLRTFGLDDFDTPNDTLYIIPYIADPIAIEDEEYGLTLVVTD
ncbi:MAG: hypothetical protein KTR29_25270 [Rhodothermaceae bacterium]|nr:hypothetical protein [Rhodothermaceae bacterium]